MKGKFGSQLDTEIPNWCQCDSAALDIAPLIKKRIVSVSGVRIPRGRENEIEEVVKEQRKWESRMWLYAGLTYYKRF